MLATTLMTCRILILLLLCLPAAWSTAWGVSLGDARDIVLRELGRPDTAIVRDDQVEVWTYPSGVIQLRNGAVCYILLTDGTVPAAHVPPPEIDVQLRIAELEARLAAAHARLARAEAAVRKARSGALGYSGAANGHAHHAPLDPPRSWRGSTWHGAAGLDAAVYVSATPGL